MIMYIASTDQRLQYSGRMDQEGERKIVVFPCSYVRVCFHGTDIRAVVDNKNNYWDNYLGVLLDGVQTKVPLSNEPGKQTIVLGENLEAKDHDLMLFKRQDACHEWGFYGFEIDGELLEIPQKPTRKIEVYGDSVSAGEVAEAVEFVGQHDPEWHRGECSNSYESYAWKTARMLNAEIHDIAQGGIALLDNTGWFNAPDYIGMESAYDKVRYNPAFGTITDWDFSKYTPDVVIVAIGQNDNHPEDYMAEDPTGTLALRWKSHYKAFIEKLLGTYPGAEIVLCTTILEHHKNWDLAIDEVAKCLRSPRVHHFLFSKNGVGTPGHIRTPEAEEMARELSAYLEGLDIMAWRN